MFKYPVCYDGDLASQLVNFTTGEIPSSHEVAVLCLMNSCLQGTLATATALINGTSLGQVFTITLCDVVSKCGHAPILTQVFTVPATDPEAGINEPGVLYSFGASTACLSHFSAAADRWCCDTC